MEIEDFNYLFDCKFMKYMYLYANNIKNDDM